MSSLTNNEKLILEKFLEMSSGYVLDFTNRSFQDFIKTAVDRDIYDDKYDRHSGSKANRLRAFWDIENDPTVGKLLIELIEYARTKKILADEDISDQEEELFKKVKNKAKKMTGEDVDEELETEKDLQDIELTKLMIDSLNLTPDVKKIVTERIGEIKKCVENNIPLAAIFLCGSTLEGLLLEVAKRGRKKFLVAQTAPKDSKSGKVLPVEKWKLNDLINTAYKIGILKEDVKRHTHTVRHFRNYIHPNQQSKEKFFPSKDTAAITWKVLKAAINQIAKSYET